MTRKEFTLRSEEADRRYAGQTLVLCASLTLGLVMAIWFEHRYGDFIYGPSVLIPFTACMVWMVWSGWRLPRELGLLCPHCAFALVGPVGQQARLTGKCRRCGNGVFEETPCASRRPNRDGTRTKPEFISRMNALTRRANRRMVVVLLLGVSAVIGCLPLVKYLNHLTELGRVEWRYPAAWTMAGLLVAVVFAPFCLLFLIAKGRLKRPGVSCPDCGKVLFGPGAQAAIATGKCVYCGEWIF